MQNLSKFFILRRDEKLVSAMKNVGVDLPAPLKISYAWNYGSLLMLFLFSQIMTGMMLATKYIADMKGAFSAMDSIFRKVWGGWVNRYLHVSGSSFFFLFLYLHMGRGLYFRSFVYMKTWMSGVTMMLVSMASAFLGYVLPWGQMSYWGATVITNFFSVMPYVGKVLVMWMWGSFSVDYPTLTRFFSFHFLFPLVMLFLVGLHVMFLHETGSNNPLGMNSSADKVVFFPYYMSKDFLGFFMCAGVLILFFFSFPGYFMEYQKYIQANSLVTPPHIQPEWYFLSAYAILRAVPNKLGGVLALVLFVVMYYFLPLLQVKNSRSKSFNFISQMIFWMWVVKLIILTWMGACPVEDPFVKMSRMGFIIYFGYFFMNV